MKKSAFTLIELMIALAVIVILFTAFYGAFLRADKTSLANRAHADLQDEARRVCQIFVEELRHAAGATASEGALTVRGVETGASIVYAAREDGSLVRKTGDAERLLSRHLKAETLRFDVDERGLVTIAFTLERLDPSKPGNRFTVAERARVQMRAGR